MSAKCAMPCWSMTKYYSRSYLEVGSPVGDVMSWRAVGVVAGQDEGSEIEEVRAWAAGLDTLH